jgi:hypothetical protein
MNELKQLELFSSLYTVTINCFRQILRSHPGSKVTKHMQHGEALQFHH